MEMVRSIFQYTYIDMMYFIYIMWIHEAFKIEMQSERENVRDFGGPTGSISIRWVFLFKIIIDTKLCKKISYSETKTELFEWVSIDHIYTT